MNNPIGQVVEQGGKKARFWGWVSLIAGILAILSPMVAGIAVVTVVAILLIISGIGQLIHAFQTGSFGRGLLAVLFGGITLLCGIALLGAPLIGLASLTLILAIYFVIDGIFTILASLQHKPEAGWGFLLFNGIVTLVLGWLIWGQWPVSGVWAIGILVGIRMLFSGLTMISLGSIARRAGQGMQAG